MDEAEHVEGARTMIPVLKTLLGYVEARNEEGMMAYKQNTVYPAYRIAFKQPRPQGHSSLLFFLVEGAINGCGNALSLQDTPDRDEVFTLGVESARSCIGKIEEIVAAEPVAAQA